MNSHPLSKRLQALSLDSSKRTKAGQLREVIDDVEKALAAGVRQSDVIALLASEGLVMSLNTFESALRRIRNQRKKSGNAPSATAPVQPPKLPSAKITENEPESETTASHRPESIDRIVNSTPDLNALSKLGKKHRQ